MSRLLLMLVAAGVLLAGCGAGTDKSSSSSSSKASVSSSSSSHGVDIFTPGVIPGDSALGKTSYEQGCQFCHGASGEGSTQLKSPSLIGCSVCNNGSALASYIETSMPPGGAQSAVSCAGDCAINVAKYILEEFNAPPDYSACDDHAPPSPSTFKRLSRQEYSSTLEDLFQLSSPPNVAAIPDDPSIDNFKTFADIQNVQASHINGYISVATEQAEALMQSATRRDKVLGCNYTASSCLEQFVGRFGRLAYRRPLTAEESNRVLGQVAIASESVSDQYIMAIQLLLSSPNFIYRVEVGDSQVGTANLGRYELASRLAFALWGRGPNAALLDQAANGELDTPEGLSRVAQQMLTDERAKASVSQFFEQWLATNLLQAPVDKPSNWYNGIIADMKSETDSLLREYAWQDKNFMGVFTENHTYVTPALANYYGLPAPQGDNPLQLPGGDPRQYTGIITQLANMFPKSDGDLVAKRGAWLRSTFLCATLRLPEGIDDVINGEFAGLGAIEIIAERNRDASCNRCHAQIDPIGVAFANFARDGRYDHEVDLTDYPIAPGFPDANNSNVKSIQDIAQALAQMPEVGQCLADRLFLYTRNHAPAASDRCAVHKAGQQFENDGNQFSSLLLALVEHPSFRVRQVPEPSEEQQPDLQLENVALNKSVTAATPEANHPPSYLTDGISADSELRWSAQGFPQTITVDLASVYTLVQAEAYPLSNRAYRYRVEVSTDGSNYTRVIDRTQNNQGGNVITDVFAPARARYVRVVVTGAGGDYTGDWVSFRELKFFGSR